MDILQGLAIVGYIGIFLYGLKLVSEALQKMVGGRLRGLITTMSSTRGVALFSGIFISALIQSSSATTVMVVSFVNTGLLTLAQAFHVIMGANIGTTVTAWIIALAAFRTDIASLAIPLLAFGVPFIFSKNNTRRTVGELIFGIALFFVGINGLENGIPCLLQHPEVAANIAWLPYNGLPHALLFTVTGFVLAALTRSSSAIIAFVIIVCANGWISVEQGVVLVIGSNLGSSVMANRAARSGNVSARRAAFSHFILNATGCIWILLFFHPFVEGIQWLVAQWGLDNAMSVAFSLALSHTLYNVVNVLIACCLSQYIVRFVTRAIAPRKYENPTEEEFHLNHISTGLLSTAELSLVQAHREIELYCQRTLNMFLQVRSLFRETDKVHFGEKYNRIRKYESISDRMEVEIAGYLGKISEGRLSSNGKRQVQANLKIIAEIEGIADLCYSLARTIFRQHEQNIVFTNDIKANIELMFNLLESAAAQLPAILSNDNLQIADLNKCHTIENEINTFRTQLKAQNILDVNEGKYPYLASSFYMDIITECERMGDCMVDMATAVGDVRLYLK
ncbi:MAG: Na/Pi cotransporter family protein [Prevotellaceae bacterium]|nr:Na/Pi cotransporter family protein [Prevotellaceae bacterium]